MEKVITGLTYILAGLALILCRAAPVYAGTVFFSPDDEFTGGPNGEVFPESRFGSPPIKVNAGLDKGYASRAVQDMDTNPEDQGAAPAVSRAPAGLVMAGDDPGQSAPVSPRAITPRAQDLEASFAIRQPVSDASEISRKGVQEVAIIAGDLGYFPKTIFVSRDVPVRMFVTSASKNTLCIMMDSFQVRKQVRSQKIEEITFTPGNPGKYRFYCPVNGMEGTLVVKELTGTAAAYNPPISRTLISTVSDPNSNGRNE
jgi:plastocyanin